MASKDDAAEHRIFHRYRYPPAKSTDINRTAKFSSLWAHSVKQSARQLPVTEYLA